MKITFKIQSLTVFFFTTLLLSCPVMAIEFFGKNKDYIYQTGTNKYIKFTSLDTQKYGLNDHPKFIDQQQLAEALRALSLQKEGGFFSGEKIVNVFTLPQIELLAKYIPLALSAAKPDQDIVFALDKVSRKALGLADLRYMTGRFFIQDGKLNLIIGEYDFFRSKAFESQYDPSGRGDVPYDFNMGSRTRMSKVFEGAPINAAGISNKQLDKYRFDWFVIDVPAAAEGYLTKQQESVQPSNAEKQLELEAARLARQRREMRAEMARMRKEIDGISSNGEASQGASAKSIEERMATLDELLAKKLITQDEYDSKRKEILNDI